MDYERLKDQWSDVEERDGVRLSWNTFPSTRMVCLGLFESHTAVDKSQGSLEAGGTDRSIDHTTERKA